MIQKTFLLLITVFTVLASSVTHAQPVLNATKTNFHAGEFTETFSMTDHENNIHIFLTSSNKIGHLMYDSSFNLLKENRYEVTLGEVNLVQGYYFNQDKINIYFSNNKLNKFHLFTLEHDEKFELSNFEFEKGKEVVIQKINAHNNFYILTSVKKSSILKIYNFKNSGYDTFFHDFSEETFLSQKNEKTTLWNILKRKSIEVFEDDIPTSIVLSAEPIKIYPGLDEVTITLNHRKNLTRIITLNLTSQKNEIDYLLIPEHRIENKEYHKSNSFIYNNVIYQILCDNHQLIIQFFDRKEKKLINEFHLDENDNLYSQNTPIFEGTAVVSVDNEVIHDTKTFLKKLSSTKVAIAALEKNGSIITTVGANGIRTNNFTGVPMKDKPFFEMKGDPLFEETIGGIPIATFGPINISITPIIGSFYSYSKSKSVYTRYLFNPTNFEHKKGYAVINVFDLIAVYKGREIKDIAPSYENIFKYNDHFIYGYLTDQEYRLVKF